jgi:hypothetical protein
MQIIKGMVRKPRRVLLYGTHGIGKSTWASQSPKPIFLSTEDGLGKIDVDHTPLIRDFETMVQSLAWLKNENHG